MRSKNLYGPYEQKLVMDEGQSPIDGPHQGAWVNTAMGEDWFLHFQDKDAYGRMVHLEPMTWKDNWTVIGLDKDGDGKGEPVLTYRKPKMGKLQTVIQNPAESDEFDGNGLGLQWQWNANPKAHWSYLYPTKGVLRLYSAEMPDDAKNLWFAPNLLMQKFPAEEFMATAKLEFKPSLTLKDEKVGLAVMALCYANIGIKHKKDGDYLVFGADSKANRRDEENEREITKLNSPVVYLRVLVRPGALYSFAYSTDGTNFQTTGNLFNATPGRWVGAKLALFCTRNSQINDSGYADIDWFRVTPIK